MVKLAPDLLSIVKPEVWYTVTRQPPSFALDDNESGVEHSAPYNISGKTIMIMHGYDKLDNGRSKLIIREMKWDRAEWPTIDL